ncbi:hypothetical protein Tco_0058649 [Tanacetum coccineum]
MKTINNISKAVIDERAKLLKPLNRVSENLEADSFLKANMKKMAEAYTTTFRNLSGLAELINNAKLPELLTKLEGFQSTLNTLSTQCASISDSLKEDPEFNQRLLKVAEGYIQNSARLTEISNSLQAINFLGFHQRISNIENTQVTMQSDISSIKNMVTEMLQAIKGMSSSAPSGSASILTALQPEVHASVKGRGENLEKQKLEYEAAETPMEQELERPTRAVPISTVRPITRPNPKVSLIESSSRPPLTDPSLKSIEGKGIAIGDEVSPQKPMPASTVVCQDPDEPIRIPYEIHGKIYNLANDEIQEYLNKEEEIKKKA